MLRQIRNALIAAFVLSLAVTGLSYATAGHEVPLDVVPKGHTSAVGATSSPEDEAVSEGSEQGPALEEGVDRDDFPDDEGETPEGEGETPESTEDGGNGEGDEPTPEDPSPEDTCYSDQSESDADIYDDETGEPCEQYSEQTEEPQPEGAAIGGPHPSVMR